MNWYEPICCDSWRNAPDLQTCVAWSCENFWGFKIMKSKGSAWDVVFSDLSLNTALSALTHGSPRKRALWIKEWFRGKRVSRESILHFPGINRLSNREIRCICSMPIATSWIFSFDFISGSSDRLSIKRHVQKKKGGLGSSAKQTTRVRLTIDHARANHRGASQLN